MLSETKEAILSGSLRERMERHRSDPNCANCHAKLDPPGFVFENYDAIGRWRSKDGEFAIDASGSLPTGESFDGPKAFKAYLINHKDMFAHCLVEKMLTYALGRGLEPEDTPEVDRITAALAQNGYRAQYLIEQIATSTPFRLREVPRSAP
jgi:hypothetical protein